MMAYLLPALVLLWVRYRTDLGAKTVPMVAIVLLLVYALMPVRPVTGAEVNSELGHERRVALVWVSVAAVSAASLLHDPAGKRKVSLFFRRAGGLFRKCFEPINVGRGGPFEAIKPERYGPMLMRPVRKAYGVLFRHPAVWAWGWVLLGVVLLLSVRLQFEDLKKAQRRYPPGEGGAVEHEPVPQGSAESLLASFRKRPESLSASELAEVEAHFQSELRQQPWGWRAAWDLLAAYRGQLPVIDLPSLPLCIVGGLLGLRGWRALWRSRLMRGWRVKQFERRELR